MGLSEVGIVCKAYSMLFRRVTCWTQKDVRLGNNGHLQMRLPEQVANTQDSNN